MPFVFIEFFLAEVGLCQERSELLFKHPMQPLRAQLKISLQVLEQIPLLLILQEEPVAIRPFEHTTEISEVLVYTLQESQLVQIEDLPVMKLLNRFIYSGVIALELVLRLFVVEIALVVVDVAFELGFLFVHLCLKSMRTEVERVKGEHTFDSLNLLHL